MGLIGSQGILPLPEFIAALRSHLGAERYWFVPMVFWLDSSDFTIQVVCWAGGVLSLLLVFGILPRLSLLLLYVLYLSLIYAGQVFMAYQWDMFLVEAGFLALVLSVATMPGIWLLRWLLFRFMLMSGAVKLLRAAIPLGKFLRAILPFFDPAVADSTGMVRGTTSGSRTGLRHGNSFFRRAGFARPDFLPTTTSFRCRFWYFAAADMHFPYRQLQFFQSANHVPVPAAV